MSGGWFLNGEEPVAVQLGACLCPGGPHADGDTVYLRPALDYAGGLLVTATIASSGAADAGQLEETLGRSYLAAGILDWTFVDDAGGKVPVTRDNIARLRWHGALIPLANRASDLYGDEVLSPLLAAGASPASGESDYSPTGPSVLPTSPIRRPSSKRRKR